MSNVSVRDEVWGSLRFLRKISLQPQYPSSSEARCGSIVQLGGDEEGRGVDGEFYFALKEEK